LKEKLLAAHRGGIRTVLIPEDNRKDLKDIPKVILDALTIHPVQWIDQVLEIALARQPEPWVATVDTTTEIESEAATENRVSPH
jgi:ATP-dependent Lon protease